VLVFQNNISTKTPTLPATPKKIGIEEVQFTGHNEPIFHTMIRYTSLFNLTGHPALSIPCGLSTKDTLPIGLQLVSKKHREDLLIKVGYSFEESTLSSFYTERDRKLVK
jgi:aspartyl-tRNA(Asn)/glutamyl-tRNA(Gln) amidotransferase subunit A